MLFLLEKKHKKNEQFLCGQTHSLYLLCLYLRFEF